MVDMNPQDNLGEGGTQQCLVSLGGVFLLSLGHQGLQGGLDLAGAGPDSASTTGRGPAVGVSAPL